MHDWVSWLCIHSSHSLRFVLLYFASCFIHTQRVLSVYVYLCVCVRGCLFFLFCCFSPVPYMFVFVLVLFCLYLSGPLPSPTSYRTLPSLSSLSLRPVPLWLRCSRRHSQTHSGVLTQSGHDTEWPAAPQTGVKRFGLVAGEPRRKWVSFFCAQCQRIVLSIIDCATANDKMSASLRQSQ